LCRPIGNRHAHTAFITYTISDTGKKGVISKKGEGVPSE
jgi:hypothetical protein